MRTIGVIPARYQSTRFPGKPLALICGVPMIIRVLNQARLARCLDNVIVATDDERIADTVRQAEGSVVMTDANLPSGTDRVAAAIAHIRADHVVNIQGDEPLIDPLSIDQAVGLLRDDPRADMATLATPITDITGLINPNIVKVLVNRHGHAVYFSRTPIPCPLNQAHLDISRYLRHIGLYVYRRSCLEHLVSLPPCWSETVERLEQLRALDTGYRIAVRVIDRASPGVDTPEDIAIIEAMVNVT
ncbi:3-deoxy-manno-octulosonate cytidylyltransferase [bacterium]|nr:3-deoxy-manno-octulosonate cytidylyltransferase [candidate division CSSED10-310 bacterium]